jgi:hypothetical protein
MDGLPKLLSNDSSADWWIEHVTKDVVTFFEDGVFEVESGIFFLTPKQWPEYRYPWIYCGNFSYYKLTGRFLEIYNPSQKTWSRFEVLSLEGGKMRLSGRDTIFSLTKAEHARLAKGKVAIQQIELKVLDLRFFVDKRLVLGHDDSLKVYDFNAEPGSPPKVQKLKLPEGFFAYVSNKMLGNNVLKLSDLHDEVVCGRQIKLELTTSNGKKTIRSEGYLPEDIKSVIIPLIYCDDLLNYPELWYRVNFKKY